MTITQACARQRTLVKTFMDPDITNLETAFNDYEQAMSEDATKTYQVTIKATGWDGVNYFIIAEVMYPERTEDPLAYLPEILP